MLTSVAAPFHLQGNRTSGQFSAQHPTNTLLGSYPSAQPSPGVPCPPARLRHGRRLRALDLSRMKRWQCQWLGWNKPLLSHSLVNFHFLKPPCSLAFHSFTPHPLHPFCVASFMCCFKACLIFKVLQQRAGDWEVSSLERRWGGFWKLVWVSWMMFK